MRKLFLSLDKSQDGLLTLDEIREGLTQVFGQARGNMKEFEDLMLALDKNCNKVIDYSEFITAAISKERLLTEENLMTAFKMFDSDGNGTISQDELKNIYESNGTKKD